jgi:hypothetical protein
MELWKHLWSLAKEEDMSAAISSKVLRTPLQENNKIKAYLISRGVGL